MKIIIAILIFGFLIFIHELGHYIAARSFGVGIYEFAIGMGPKVFSRVSKKTGITYSIRLFPIGGFVSMDGEEDSTESDASLNKKPKWQRFIVMFAGAFMNLLVGFILTAILVLTLDAFGSAKIAKFEDGAVSSQSGLMVGDTIVKIGAHGVHTSYDLSYTVLHECMEPIDVTVIRNGEKVLLHDVSFPTRESMGGKYGATDFYVAAETKSFGNIVKQTFWRSVTSCRMIWESLFDLITGRYGIESLSGPVGVTGAIGEAVDGGITDVLSLSSLIAINLGICNLLPFPALDGGRILLLFIEAIRGKPLKREVEGYINFAGLMLLMLLMIFITYIDITRLV